MRRSAARWICPAMIACLALAGCGSGARDTAGTDSSPITAGLLIDLTGPYASFDATAENGVKARLALQNAEGGVYGRKIEYAVADTTSTPPGSLTAAQSLVRSKGAFAVLGAAVAVGPAADFLHQQSVPVLGISSGAVQFGDPTFDNMFATTGSYGTKYPVADTLGKYLASQGVTSMGTVGVGTSAGSTNAAKAGAESAKAAGIGVGYVNTSLTNGTTDVGSIAVQIKDSGINGLYLPIVPSTALAILTALKQQGVQLKSAVLLTGYGADLLASPPTVAAAQGGDFAVFTTPAEMNTPATQRLSKALKDYAGLDRGPTASEMYGWVMADAFISGLEKAGPNPTQKSFMAALRGVRDYNAGGLYTAGTVDFSQFGNIANGLGPGNCLYITKLIGNAFQPVADASPVCGKLTGQNMVP